MRSLALAVLAALAACANTDERLVLTLEDGELDADITRAEDRAHEMILAAAMPGFPLDISNEGSTGKAEEAAGKSYDFVDERMLGAGSYGQVHLALHVPTGERFAVKAVGYSAKNSNQPYTRVANELAINVELAGTGVVPELRQIYHDAPTGNTTAVIDYIPGMTLFKVIDALEKIGRADMRPALAVLIAAPLLRAIETLQAHGIVHNDITVANIMVVIGDSARLPAVKSHSPPKTTSAGTPLPTDTRSPIEQASLSALLGLDSLKLPAGKDKGRRVPSLYLPGEESGFDTIVRPKDRASIHRAGGALKAMQTVAGRRNAPRVEIDDDLLKSDSIDSTSSSASDERLQRVKKNVTRHFLLENVKHTLSSPRSDPSVPARIGRDDPSEEDISRTAPQLQIKLIDLGQAVRIKNPKGNREARDLVIGDDLEWMRFEYSSDTPDSFRPRQDVFRLGKLLAYVAGRELTTWELHSGMGTEWGEDLLAEYPALVALVRACLAEKTPEAARLIRKHMAALEAEAERYSGKVVGVTSPLHHSLSESCFEPVFARSPNESSGWGNSAPPSDSPLKRHIKRSTSFVSSTDSVARYSPRGTPRLALTADQRSVFRSPGTDVPSGTSEHNVTRIRSVSFGDDVSKEEAAMRRASKTVKLGQSMLPKLRLSRSPDNVGGVLTSQDTPNEPGGTRRKKTHRKPLRQSNAPLNTRAVDPESTDDCAFS